MQTQTDEIADGVYRFSTLVPDAAGPGGFMFNQFLILAEQPMLSTAAAAGCSRWFQRLLRRWSRSSGCAGSVSATSSPTSAAA